MLENLLFTVNILSACHKAIMCDRSLLETAGKLQMIFFVKRAMMR